MDKNLEKWACSFSGCDGGNPNSNIWLCGIEWGYENATEEQREDYYKYGLANEIKQGEHKLDKNYNFFTDESMKFPFNLAFAKLYSALQSEDGEVSSVIKKSNELLKLNLSPIAFRKDDNCLWNEDIIQTTGFKTKVDFVKYLNSLNRFKSIRNEYKPKLIICIGNSYKNDFLKCFFGEENIQLNEEALKPEDSNKNQNKRYMYHAKHNGTLLVVTPFSTSSNGLNSDFLIQEAGRKIKKLLNN
jgi:hypothetical protein